MNHTLQFSDLTAAIIWNAAVVSALVVAFIIQLREGKRRGFDMFAWTTVLAVVYISLQVGERVGAFSMQDWVALFGGHGLPAHPEKTALGGAVIALPVFWALSKWLRLPAGSLDVFVLPLLLASAFARIGCLLAGCCYGTVSGSEWGLCYGPGMPAHDWQVAQGIIAAGAASTLPLMPVQLIYIMTGLLAFALLWKVRNRFRVAGSLGWLTVAVMAFNRFGIEFFREAITNRGFLGHFAGGLKVAQWICLLLTALALFACWRNERRAPSRVEHRPVQHRPLPYLAGLVLVSALVAVFFTPILMLEERIVLLVSGVPALYYMAKAIRQAMVSRQPVLASAGMFSATIVALMTIPIDTIAPPSGSITAAPVGQDSLPLIQNRHYAPWKKGDRAFDFGIGGTIGSYRHEIVQRDCGGNVVNRREASVHNRSAAFDATYSIGMDNSRVAFGLRGLFGSSKSEVFPEKTYDYQSFSPYMVFDFKAVGAHAGLLFNRFTPNEAEPSRVLPSIGLRLGLLNRFHIDAAVWQNHGWSFYPEPAYSAGMNYGFEDSSGAKNVRLGLGAVNNNPALFLGARYPLGNTPLLADFSAQVNQNIMANFGLRYRFWRK